MYSYLVFTRVELRVAIRLPYNKHIRGHKKRDVR